MFKTTSAALLLAPTIAPSAAHAAAAPSPRFVNTPSAAFGKSTSSNGSRFYTMGVVVRFRHSLPKTGARVVIGPDLKTGQNIGGVLGGDTPHRIGVTSRHCYDIEVGRPRPVSTPKVGARWKVAVASTGGIIVDTATTTLRAFPAGGDYGPEEARHLGWPSPPSKSATDGLIGRREHVQIKQLLVYDDPAKSYIGSLQPGERASRSPGSAPRGSTPTGSPTATSTSTSGCAPASSSPARSRKRTRTVVTRRGSSIPVPAVTPGTSTSAAR